MVFSNNEPFAFKVSHSPQVRLSVNAARDLLAAAAFDLGIPASICEYRCPFDFIEEFDKWFEFHRRLYFDKEASYSVIRSMLATDDRKLSDYIKDDCNYSSARLDSDQWSRRLNGNA